MKGKKGQVTVFMIIGMVVLVSAGIYLYFRTTTLKEVETIESHALPVKTFVETCMKGIADDSLTTMGLNGGFLHIPPEIERNPRSYLPTLPISSLKNPYWWYDGISNVPTEEFMNAQLAEEMDKALPGCLNNFEEFGKEFSITPLGKMETDVSLIEEAVLFRTRYPMKIQARLNKTQTQIDEFQVGIPVRLKAVYNLARQIMAKENIDMFVEKKTIDLMSMDTEIPTTDIQATCSPKIWEVDDVRDKIKTLLRVNLPYIRIANTEYDDNAYVPLPQGKDRYKDSYYQYHYVWKISNEKYKNMHASFTYDENWGLDMAVRPSDGSVLRSNAQKGFDMLSFFCLHIWHFTYDLGFPVKVTITDDETKDHKKYVFSFAFKTAIDHNTPVRNMLAANLMQSTERMTTEEYCRSTLVNEISILTEDNVTNNPAPFVNLTFTCGRYTCDIGNTEWLSFGAAAGLTKILPYCVNAVVRGSKPGYDDAWMFIQTDIPDKVYTLQLRPVKGFVNYNVLKHPWDNLQTALPLEEDEKASILIKRKTDGSADYQTFGIYPVEGNFPIKLPAREQSTLEVNIYLTKDKDMIGGYQGVWAVSADDIESGDEITFHVVEKEHFIDDNERFLFLSGLSSYSEKIPKPEIR